MKIKLLENGSSVTYRFFDSCCHPEALDHLEDEEIDDLIEKTYETRVEQAANSSDPSQELGQGQITFIGYDAEWVERPNPNGQTLNVLSYQFFLVGVGGEISATFLPASEAFEDRLELQEMLAELLRKALKCGIILDYPAQVVLVGFFLRADLAMLADLVEFKEQLGNVGGKIATTGKPVAMGMACKRLEVERIDKDRRIFCGRRENGCLVHISFYDIAKHAPEKTPLSVLGDLLQLPKLDIPQGYSIARMDELKAGDFDAFLEYGIRDAEIAVKYYLRLLAFAREQVGGQRIKA